MATFLGKYVGAKQSTKPSGQISPQHKGSAFGFLHDVAALPANMAIGDIVVMGTIPSNAVISRALSKFFFDAAGVASSKWNIGVLEPSGQLSCIASNIDAATVIAAGQNAMNIGLANDGKQLWELAGYSANPNRHLTVVVSLAGAAGPAAAFNMELELFHK